MAKKKSSLPVEKIATAVVDKMSNPSRSSEDTARERKWKVEDALRTLQSAEEVRKDKSLVREAKQLAKTKMRELKNIC